MWRHAEPTVLARINGALSTENISTDSYSMTSSTPAQTPRLNPLIDPVLLSDSQDTEESSEYEELEVLDCIGVGIFSLHHPSRFTTRVLSAHVQCTRTEGLTAGLYHITNASVEHCDPSIK
jgi:hypothetical protein